MSTLGPQWKDYTVRAFYLFITALLALSWYGYFYWFDSDLELIFLDVGQGDSFLVRTPDKVTMLVDGGKPGTALAKVRQALKPWEKVDVIMASHADSDHVGDLAAVAQQYNPLYFLVNKVADTNESYLKLLSLSGQGESERWDLQAGSRLRLGCCVMLDIVWPPTSAPEIQDDFDTNYYSTSFILRYGNFRLLAGGDIPTAVEELLVEQGSVPASLDVLKVNHHGSNTSTSLEFLRYITPHVSLIQTGKNSYGHPRPEVVANLQKTATKIYRNDQHGMVKYQTDGYHFKITTEK